MIRKLLATTAVATLIATGAIAQTTTPAPMDPATTQAPMVVRAEGHLATNIIGKTVYNGTGDEAENIGSVNDLVIGPDGEIKAIVVGVGGFLGLGQKNVALEYDLVEWAERDGDRWLVVATTQDALKAQADFDRSAYQPMPADADVVETRPATREDLAAAPAAADGVVADDTAAVPAEPMTDDTAAAPAPADQTAQAPVDDTATAAIDRNNLQPMEQMRTEDFVGTTVYGANDENVGSIGDIVLNADGEVDAVIIDVGGFLGMGTKEVAVGLDNLAFMTDGDGNRYLYTEFTKEQLEAAPEYDDTTYVERRDDMRVVVPN